MYWKKQASTSLRYGDKTTAKQYYDLALECAPEQAVEMKRECWDALADIYFWMEEFSLCVENGIVGYNTNPTKNEVGVSSFLSMISFGKMCLFLKGVANWRGKEVKNKNLHPP